MRDHAATFALCAVLAATSIGAAAEAAEPGGTVLYRRYCASCHGTGGHGDGPAAAAMCPPPTDLTRIEHDERDLMALIDGRRPVRAHGTSAMPIWGMVFEESLLDTPHARRTALLRLQELARYVRTLRARKPESERSPSPAP